jgi:hypothetical protein
MTGWTLLCDVHAVVPRVVTHLVLAGQGRCGMAVLISLSCMDGIINTYHKSCIHQRLIIVDRTVSSCCVNNSGSGMAELTSIRHRPALSWLVL